MFVGRQFSPAAPGESEPYSLDFTNDLNTGETLSTATVTLTVNEGVDASVATRLSGSPGISGNVVSQRIVGLLPGVTYTMTAAVTTNQSNTKKLSAHIPCIDTF